MSDEYTITSQQQVNAVNPATGRVVRYWEVLFTDQRTQTHGKVLVDVDGYNVERVRAKINEQLAAIRQVADLTN